MTPGEFNNGTCRCHEPSIKSCGVHGMNLVQGLLPEDRVISSHTLFFLRHCLDPKKCEEFTASIRRAMAGQA